MPRRASRDAETHKTRVQQTLWRRVGVAFGWIRVELDWIRAALGTTLSSDAVRVEYASLREETYQIGVD
eukprot:1559220-Lingulodinium_polyedra.AAC.1